MILATLVGLGLTLPWLIRRLGVADDGGAEREEARAREPADQAAVARIESLVAEWPDHRELLDQLRDRYATAPATLSRPTARWTPTPNGT